MKYKYLVLLLLLGLLSCKRYKDNGQAKRWVNTFYPGEIGSAQCQDYDTDHNGYVSCTAKVGSRLVALECPMTPDGCDCSYNTECRLAKGFAIASESE